MSNTGIWRTVITGAVLLVPIFALLYFAAQIFMMVRGVFLPIVDYLNIERALGLIVLNLLVVECSVYFALLLVSRRVCRSLPIV